MIWIVSKSVANSNEELEKRHQFIQRISQTAVSPWSERSCKSAPGSDVSVSFYQCISRKGEYGLVITAHMNAEVQPILQQVLSPKKALVVINSCQINEGIRDECFRIVKSKNPHSEMFFAKQEAEPSGYLFNYTENVGTFGFPTTRSERELFQKRQLGLVKAIRAVYEKVVPG